MKEITYLASAPGRIFAGTVGFALAGAGAVALLGASAPPAVVPLVVLGCIVGSILALGLTVDRYPGHALALVIALPFVAGFYFAGVKVAVGGGTLVGIPLLVASIGPLTVGAAGNLFVRRPAAPPRERHVH
jgi:hypothetical protein